MLHVFIAVYEGRAPSAKRLSFDFYHDLIDKDRLSELEQFKQECTVLFQGPLFDMKVPQ